MEDPCPSSVKRKLLDSSPVEQEDDRPSSPPSAKRRRIDERTAVEGPTIGISSIDSSDSLPKSSSAEPPPIHLPESSNKVIWVDIGLNAEETYWWPGLVFETHLKTYVALMANSKSTRVDTTPKLLDSLKATKPFKAYSSFDPVLMNPILKIKGSSSKYPRRKSLEEAYLIALEKHAIYVFEEADDLPEVSACMIPLSQESRAVVGKVLTPELDKAPSDEPDELDEILDVADQELEIPGETVVCRMNGRSQDYWPARVMSYVGLKAQRRGVGQAYKKTVRSEKTYRIQFCDGSYLVAPRSSFWTIDQDEFYRVKLGQIKTREVKFEELKPQIIKQLDQLDLIINGKSKDPKLIIKHENFLSSLKTRGSIPRDVRYGKYSEELIHEVGDYLRDRYLVLDEGGSSSRMMQRVDGRFSRLSEKEKSQYIFDILVPELIWLMTVSDYLEDGRERLMVEGGSESSSSELLLLLEEEAKRLARVEIDEVDLVDRVISLRVQRQKDIDIQGGDPNSHSKLRQTYNSRKSNS